MACQSVPGSTPCLQAWTWAVSEIFAAREHVDNQLHALDPGLWALCGLQAVGNRIQIGLVECRVELLCLGVTCELPDELRRHRCVSERIVRSGPAPIGFGRF